MKKFCTLMVLCFALAACSDEVSGENDNVRTGDNQTPDAGPGGTDDAGGDGGGDFDGLCDPGEALGCDGAHGLRVCDESGEGQETVLCPDATPNCIDAECTDQLCEPGVSTCSDGETRASCNEDGTGYVEEVPCAAGQVCSNGSCTQACQFGAKMAESYFGCEYWTVYLDQYDDPTTGMAQNEIPHAVVLSNPNEVDATVNFQAVEPGVSFDIPNPVVPAGDARSFTMPRVPMEQTGKSRAGLFIESTMPVTAHQFNPLNNENVYSNDASLLIPVSSLGTEYYAMSWPTQGVNFDDFEFDFPFSFQFGDFDFDPQKGFVTVIATESGTTTNVTVTPTADIADGEDLAGFPAGVSRTFQLAHGEVLNLQAEAGGMTDGLSDLTGTHIIADHPVVVFGGHEQAVVAYDDSRESCCADHIEQQMFPLDSWGQRYIAPFSPGRTQTKDLWRILAGEDGVTVHTDPVQPEANGVTLNAGEFVEFFTADDFVVEADGKISVAQYLTGQAQTAEFTGDPAMVLAIPVERWRDEYMVLIPEGYNRDFVTVIRPAGVEVELEGSAIADTEFDAVAGGEFETASIEVNPGVYTLLSPGEEPFGVLVHGLDSAVSYGYPGGLNMVGAEQ